MDNLCIKKFLKRYPKINFLSIEIYGNGFSKAYSMTGWRLGYMAASKDLISALIRINIQQSVQLHLLSGEESRH